MNLVAGERSSNKVISTEDMKEFLKIESTITLEDDLIDSLVKSAVRTIEREARIALLTQTWTYYLDRILNKIELPRPPLQSLTSFYYYNDSYTEYEVDSDLYQVVAELQDQPGFILKNTNSVWPVYTSNGNGIKIIYLAGFGDDASDIPDDLILAVKSLACHYFENRESSEEIPTGIKDIIDSRKIYY